MLQTALKYSHSLLKEVIEPGDTVIDATMGNGNDTLFLAESVGRKGHVLAFDIQSQALNTTRHKLAEKQLIERVELIHDGHEHLNEYLYKDTSIKAAIFNLGYLPKSDKNVITIPKTTKAALSQLLRHLIIKGRILIVAYYGHPGGQEELEALQQYCQELPQEQFSVLKYAFINQKNQPPILFCIEKLQ
ncbi:MAG TPA: class I SAM-dependent methyltransferase [Tetragenococcus sp.]|nr:class I SAM-dependent methyltransferase [Tetragenococcus sp.]